MGALTIRGLDTRCAVALARCTAFTDPDQAAFELADAADAAVALGLHDYAHGIDEPPLLFSDEPMLLDRWISGWQWGDAMAEMADCPGCKTGLPCQLHG